MKKLATILLASIAFVACTQTKKNETTIEHLQQPVKSTFTIHETYDTGEYMPVIAKYAPENSFRTAFNDKPMVGFVTAADTARFMEAMRTDSLRMALPEDCQVMLAQFKTDVPEEEGEIYAVYLIKMSESQSLQNPTLDDIYVSNETFAGHAVIELQFSEKDAKRWAKMTRQNIGKPVAFVMDNRALCAPRVNMEIANGASTISAPFTREEASAIVDEIIGRK